MSLFELQDKTTRVSKRSRKASCSSQWRPTSHPQYPPGQSCTTREKTKSLRRLTLLRLTAADLPLLHLMLKTRRVLKITQMFPSYRTRNCSGSSSITLAFSHGADPSRRSP